MKNMPNATDLQYFQIVAKTLNISRASERLGIRQTQNPGPFGRLLHQREEVRGRSQARRGTALKGGPLSRLESHGPSQGSRRVRSGQSAGLFAFEGRA